VELDIRKLRLERRPLALAFLDAVFSEGPLPCGNDGTDRVGVERLRDGHQRGGAGRAFRLLLRSPDPRQHILQPFFPRHANLSFLLNRPLSRQTFICQDQRGLPRQTLPAPMPVKLDACGVS
jgi:hypothetical protein